MTPTTVVADHCGNLGLPEILTLGKTTGVSAVCAIALGSSAFIGNMVLVIWNSIAGQFG
jgi:hypothetical protein